MPTTFTEDQIEQFEAIANGDDDAVDVLWEYVAPHMAGREPARKATLLTVASHADRAGMRGRIHTLLVGPPGTGKTEIRNWVRQTFPTAVGIGPKSSEAGLKGDASGDEITPGALNMAHGSALCIDELDKFAKSERDSLYEAMSEGEYDIKQGEHRKILQAEVRVVATANSMDPFKPAIRDRFDAVLELDEYSAEQTAEVADHLQDNFMKGFVEGEAITDSRMLRDYLDWLGSFEPGAADVFPERVRTMRNYLIKMHDQAGGIRQKQSWLRGAYTIARLNRRDMEPGDYLKAVQVLAPDLVAETETVRDLVELAKGNKSAVF